MMSAIARKLKIKEGFSICVVHPPENYKTTLGALPAGSRITAAGKHFDQVHWFVRNKLEMEKGLKKIRALIKNGTTAWIFYPKGSSGMQTDLSRDKGWEPLEQPDLQWIGLISFDDTWSGFGIRTKTPDTRKSGHPSPTPLSDFVDPERKTVRLPPSVADALEGRKDLSSFFHSLAFTHKREYIEWIVSAKKEETRTRRISQMIEMLEKKWKNPSGRFTAPGN